MFKIYYHNFSGREQISNTCPFINIIIIHYFLGLVDWKDYYKHFLLAKKYDVDKIDSFLKDYGDQALDMKETGESSSIKEGKIKLKESGECIT